MSTLRTVTLPIAHLAAELCAAPLGSEAAFRSACTELRVNVALGDRLWRDTEKRLVRAFPGLSLDHLVSMRDVVWFVGPSDAALGGTTSAEIVPLHTFLRRIARSYLVVHGPRARPVAPRWAVAQDAFDRPDGDDAGRRNFRWLSFALPTDLLLSALTPGDAGPHRIERVAPTLARQLFDRQFAETHLHYNAGLTFPLLWVALLHRLAAPDFGPSSLASAGAVFDEGRQLAGVLLQAAVARQILGQHLQTRGQDLRLGSLPDLGLGRAPDQLLIHALELFAQGIPLEACDFAALQTIYLELSGVGRLPIGDQVNGVPHADPLNGLLLTTDVPGRFPESRFVAMGLAHLEGAGEAPRTDDFAVLFWQIIRARCLFYRHVVQRPMTPGLTWFVRHYKRFGVVVDGLPEILRMRAAVETSGRDRGLRAIELRCQPPRDRRAGRELVQALFDLAAEERQRNMLRGDSERDQTDLSVNQGCVELGIVAHFARDRGGGAIDGHPAGFGVTSHANPRQQGYRYKEHYLSHRRRAVALGGVLREHPAALFAIRGVDVCTDELGVPAWVMRPLYLYVREAAAQAAMAIERASDRHLRPFGATAHAGEDFVHLLGGLRRVHEAIKHFQLGRGDRLGHAVALGTDPELWAATAGTVAISVEERMFDLVWEWASYRRWSGSVPGDRVRYIGDKIAELAERMFSKSCAPFQAEEFVNLLHDSAWLRFAGFPAGVEVPAPPPRPRPAPVLPPSDRVIGMLTEYLKEETVFLRGQEIEAVEPVRDRASLLWLHDRLRDEVAARGIAVEVNPSSNLLIGNLGDLDQHPMWRLNPPRPIQGVRPVAVCIGSDDPVVFATSLLEEYQLLADALTRGGVSDDDARGWLNKVRRTGLDTRFTIDPRHWPASMDDIPPLRDDVIAPVEEPP